MTRQEEQQWLTKPTIATYAMGAFAGLEIKEIIHGINNHVIFVDITDHSVHTAKLYYTASTIYFKYHGNYISLSNCLICDL